MHLQAWMPIAALTAIMATVEGNLRLKDISDPSKIIPGYPKRRSIPGVEAYDPQNEAKFYFGAQTGSDAWIGEFNLMKPGENEAIIPIERFAEQLKSIQCGNDLISIDFASKDAFDHASEVWDWVNQKAKRTITLVTAPGHCDPDAERDPYLVSDIHFDTVGLKAALYSVRLAWADVAENFDFKTRYAKLESDTEPKRVKRQDTTQTINASNGPYKDEDLKKQLDSVDALAKKLEAISNGDSADGTDVNKLEAEVENVMAAATEYIEKEAQAALEQIIKDADDSTNTKTAQDALDQFKKQAAEADEKFKEAVAEPDDSKSEDLVEQALTDDNSAAETLFDAVDKLSIAMSGQSSDETAKPPPSTRAVRRRAVHSIRRAREISKQLSKGNYERGLDKRGLFDAAKKWLKWVQGNWTTLKKVVNGVIAIYQFITADGPTTLSWDETWSPLLYKTDTDTVKEYGMTFEARAKVKTSGKIIGQVDLGFRDKKLSQYNVDLTTATDVVGSVELALKASGQLKKALDVIPLSHSIPLGQWQGQKIEVFGNNVITIGPFLNVSLHAGFPELKGNGEASWGMKATILNGSNIHLTADEEAGNDFRPWKPKFETIGPYVKSSMQGKLRAALIMTTTFEATIFGNGANITLDADVPSYGIAFRPQECHTEDAKKKTKGIGLSPYLGLELTAKGAANANAWALKPKFEKTIYSQTWSLLNDGDTICLPITEFEGNVGDKKAPGGLGSADLDGDGELDDNEAPAYDDKFPPSSKAGDKFEGMSKDFLKNWIVN